MRRRSLATNNLARPPDPSSGTRRRPAKRSASYGHLTRAKDGAVSSRMAKGSRKKKREAGSQGLPHDQLATDSSCPGGDPPGVPTPAEYERAVPPTSTPLFQVLDEVHRWASVLDDRYVDRLLERTREEQPRPVPSAHVALEEAVRLVLRACIHAADRQDLEWLTGQADLARTYLQSSSEGWSADHKGRFTAVLAYTHPQVMGEVKSMIMHFIRSNRDRWRASDPSNHDIGFATRELLAHIATVLLEEPEFLEVVADGINPTLTKTSAWSQSTRSLENTFAIYLRKDSEDPEELAESAIRAVLRAVGYPRVKSLFDAERKRS